MSVLTFEPLAVANRLRPALLRLARELRRESHALGVTGGQVSLLFQIQRHKGIGVRGLAALERMSPAAMSGYVDRLERAGLVERTPESHGERPGSPRGSSISIRMSSPPSMPQSSRCSACSTRSKA
jgi:hypothetical protein